MPESRQICMILLRTVEHMVGDTYLLLCVLVLSLVVQSDNSDFDFFTNTIKDLEKTQEFRRLVAELNRKVIRLQPDFLTKLPHNVVEAVHRYISGCRNLITIVDSLSRSCRPDTVHFMAALINLSMWMTALTGGQQMPWKAYLKNLRWSGNPSHFLAALAQHHQQFVCEVQSEDFTAVMETMCRGTALPTREITSVFKTARCLKLPASNVVGVLTHLLPMDNRHEALISLMAVSASEVDQTCMSRMMWMLSQCGGSLRQQFSSPLSLFRKRIAELILSVEREQLSSQGLENAKKLIRGAVVAACTGWTQATSSTYDITVNVRDRSVGHDCFVDLAIAHLIGAHDRADSALTAKAVKEAAQLVDALHEVRKDQLLITHLPEIVDRVCARTNNDAELIVTFMCESRYLRTSTSILQKVNKTNLLHRVNFPGYKEFCDALTEVKKVMRIVTREGEGPISYTLPGHLWRVYIIHLSNQFASLSTKEDSAFNIRLLTQFPASLEKAGIHNPSLEASLYVLLLKVVKGLTEHNRLWSVSDGGVARLFHCCHSVYKHPPVQRTGRDAFSDVYLMWKQYCDDLQSLQEKLTAKKYTEEEYDTYKPHESVLNGLLTSIDLAKVPLLESLTRLQPACRQLLTLLQWLQDRSVPGAGEASAQLQRLSRSRNDVTYSELDGVLRKCYVDFREPLEGEKVSSKRDETVASYIHHFTFNKKSHLFDQNTKHLFKNRHGGEGEEQWVRCVVRAVKAVHKLFQALLEGQLPYRDLQQLQISELAENSIAEEIDGILSFSLYAHIQERDESAQMAQRIRGVLRNIQRVQYGHLQAVVTVTSGAIFRVVNDHDSDVEYLRKLCSNEIESDTELRDLQGRFEQLDSLLRGVSDSCLMLFGLVNQFSSISKFFAENDFYSEHGLEQFQKKIDILTISVQHDVQGSRLLNAFIFAHQSLAPFCRYHFNGGVRISLRELFQVVAVTPFNRESLQTANENVSYINELLRTTTGSTSEKAADQLLSLVESGSVQVHLQSMSCSVTTYTYQYRPRTLISSPEGPDAVSKVMTMSREDVRDFRGSLQYLCSLQQEEVTLQNATDVGLTAIAFQRVQEQVDELVHVLTQLEMQGHPGYQDCTLTYQLTDEVISKELEVLAQEAEEWKEQLANVRTECSLLQLFTNQDVAVMLMLLDSSGFPRHERELQTAESADSATLSSVSLQAESGVGSDIEEEGEEGGDEQDSTRMGSDSSIPSTMEAFSQEATSQLVIHEEDQEAPLSSFVAEAASPSDGLIGAEASDDADSHALVDRTESQSSAQSSETWGTRSLFSVRSNTIRRRRARQAAVTKLTDLGKQQLARREESDVAARLLKRYLLSISRVANYEEDVDLDDVVSRYVRNSYTDCADILRHLVSLVNEVYPSLPCSRSQPGKQFVSVVAGDGNSNTNALLLLGSIYSQQDSLPCHAQILFCSEETSVDQLTAFFLRVKTFPYLVFACVGIDDLSFTCRTLVWKQQQELHKLGKHGNVHYVCLKPSASASWAHMYVQPYQQATDLHALIDDTRENLTSMDTVVMPTIVSVVGEAGNGKSHFIRRKLDESNRTESASSSGDVASSSAVISINDISDSANILRKLATVLDKGTLFFNISSHARLSDVNRIFFELLFCSALRDPLYGALLYVPTDHLARSTWYIEVPSKRAHDILTIPQLLPIVAMAPSYPDHIQMISQDTYPLQITKREELVGQLTMLLDENPPDFMHVISQTHGVFSLNPLQAPVPKGEDCLRVITRFLQRQQITGQRIHQSSFLQFLGNRMELFTNSMYLDTCAHTYEAKQQFPSKLFHHFVDESRYLCQADLRCTWLGCKQFFVIRDAGSDGLSLLPWEPFNEEDSNLEMREFLALGRDTLNSAGTSPEEKYLQWAFGLKDGTVGRLLAEKQFVLTKDFTYKLLMIHERRRSRQSLIIEGETGVGKTFLLDMYTILLNEHAATSREAKYSPRLRSRFAEWLQSLVRKTLWSELSDYVKRWLGSYSSKQSDDDLAHQNSALDAVPEGSEKLVELWESFLGHLKEEPSLQGTVLKEFQKCVVEWFKDYKLLKPLPEDCHRLLLENLSPPDAVRLLRVVLTTKSHSLFHRHLVHPGTTKTEVKEFLCPVLELAQLLDKLEVVVFFDEVNTASCLGFFKELLMDRMMDGQQLPENLFFISAINPAQEKSELERIAQDTDEDKAFRSVYFVHELPSVMKEVKWVYGSLSVGELDEYIMSKIKMQGCIVTTTDQRSVTFTPVIEKLFCGFLLAAHRFCLSRCGDNSVSQREIQRVFKLIPFFWHLEEYYAVEEASGGHLATDECLAAFNDDEQFRKCICLAVAVVYYFRLPHGAQSDGTVQRKHFQEWIRSTGSFMDASSLTDIYGFTKTVDENLDKFVTEEHFLLPQGVALTRALKENIFCTVACIETSLPLGIVGLPGSSKTLSYHIVRENLRGKHSPKVFCSQFAAIDSFFYQCSEQSSAPEIAAVFDRAIERQQRYQEQHAERIEARMTSNRADQSLAERRKERLLHSSVTRCVVFLDEAGLPREDRMELKVLHPYLDECKVAFVALSNHLFDAANTNRMVTLRRSQADPDDLQVLALGCVGLRSGTLDLTPEVRYIQGICDGYLKVTTDERFKKRFHHRDLIYTLRHLRRCDVMQSQSGMQPDEIVLLQALEENFNGVEEGEFRDLVNLFFQSVHDRLGATRRFPESLENSQCSLRSTPQILRDYSENLVEGSKRIASSEGLADLQTRLSLSPRFRMIIDETDDGSTAVDLLFQLGLLDRKSSHVFHMSDLPGDSKEIHSAEILARLRRHLERPDSIVLVNTERIHGSLYELLNQTFSIISNAKGEPQIFTKIAVGATTYACRVHPQFQCVIILKKKDLEKAPTPFLSRFSKFLLKPSAVFRSIVSKLPSPQEELLQQVLQASTSFCRHMGERNFYSFSENTLACLLLSHLEEAKGLAGDYSFSKEANSTTTTICQKYAASMGPDEAQLYTRAICGRLLQLMPPEFFVLKLSTLGDVEVYRDIYFNIQEHFKLEVVLEKTADNISSSRFSPKTILYVRSSGVLATMLESPEEFFGTQSESVSECLFCIDTTQYTRSSDIEKQLSMFVKSAKERCCVMLLDTTQWGTSQSHAGHYRHLIDTAHLAAQESAAGKDKRFVLIMQLSRHQSYTRHPCPAAFLGGWDSMFVDCPSNIPIVDVKCLAQSCAVATSRVQQEYLKDMKASFVKGISCLKDTLAQMFTSHLHQVVVSPRLVASLPAQIRPLYALHQTSINRAKAVSYILDQQSCIVEMLAEQLCEQFSGKFSLSLLRELAETVATKDIFFGFADLVDLHLKPRLQSVFNKVLVSLATNFGLASMMESNLGNEDLRKLLRLIPTASTSDQQGKEYFYLSCGHVRPQTPLFHLLKSRVEQLVKKVAMGQANAERRLESHIAEDETLRDLASSPVIMAMYRSDIIKDACEVSGHKGSNKIAIEVAAEWVNLYCARHSSSTSHLALSHTIVHVFKKQLLMLVCGSEALLSLSSDLIQPDTSFRREEDCDEYLEKFAEHLFESLWKHLSLLRVEDGDDPLEGAHGWMRSYRFITEFWSVEEDDHSSRALLRRFAKRMHLMQMAYAFFSFYQLAQNAQTSASFLDLIRAFDKMDTGRLSSRIAVTRTVSELKAVTNRHDDLVHFLIELLQLEVRRQERPTLRNASAVSYPAVSDDLVFLVETVGCGHLPTVADLKISFEPCKQVFYQLAAQLRPAGGNPTNDLRWFDFLIRAVAQYFSTQLTGSAVKDVTDWFQLFIPSDLPVDIPERMKGVLEQHMAHIFFDFVADEKRSDNEPAESHNSDGHHRREVPLTQLLTALSGRRQVRERSASAALQFVMAITEAGYVRAVLDRMVQAVLARVDADGNISTSPEFLADLDSVACSLFLIPDWPHNKLYFISKLVSIKGVDMAARVVADLDQPWSDDLKQTIDEVHKGCAQFFFSFQQESSDELHLRSPFEEFCQAFDKSVSAADNFQSLAAWCVQQLAEATKPDVLRASRRLPVFFILHIYGKHYVQGDMAALDGLADVVDTLGFGDVETRAVRLLLCTPKGLSKTMADILTPGKRPKEIGYARDILFNVLAAVVAIGQEDNHYYTLLSDPTDLLRTFLFGGINWRSPIDPRDNEVKIDCCFQFEYDGSPTYISIFALRHAGGLQCSLDNAASHLNALVSFACLCLHGLLFQEDATGHFEKVLSIPDVKDEETDESLTLLQRIYQFFCTRLFTLHYHIQNDETLSPVSAIQLVVSTMELLIRIDISAVFSSTYSHPIARQIAELLFQRMVDSAVAKVRSKPPDSEQEPLLSKYIRQTKPALSLNALQQALRREQTGEQITFPVLRSMLSERSMFANLPLAVPIADLYLWVHNWLAQAYTEEESYNVALKDAVEAFVKIAKESTDPSVRLRGETARQTHALGQEGFNKLHHRCGGLLQPGACHDRQPFDTLEDGSPLSYVVSTADQDQTDILFKVVEATLRHQDEFLGTCQTVKDGADTSPILRHLLQDVNWSKPCPC